MGIMSLPPNSTCNFIEFLDNKTYTLYVIDQKIDGLKTWKINFLMNNENIQIGF